MQVYNSAGALMNGQPLLAPYRSNQRQAAVLESAMQDSAAAVTMVNEETASYDGESDQTLHCYGESDPLKGHQRHGMEDYRRGVHTAGGAASRVTRIAGLTWGGANPPLLHRAAVRAHAEEYPPCR